MLDAHLLFIQKNKLVNLGVTGSIAAVKSVEIMRMLQKLGFIVNVTLTPSAQKFILPLSFEALNAAKVYAKMFSGDTFEHLEPSQNADIMLICPASATTMARIAYGLADELLACQALAFEKPIIFAPAMNPKMWANKSTQDNKKILEERGHIFVGPASGEVACGDFGMGRLCDLRDIIIACLYAVTKKDLIGKKVLVNYGATREQLDPIRYFSNPSSGIMGASVAMAAYLRGAEVCVIEANCDLYLPNSIQKYKVNSADEMYTQMQKLYDKVDYAIFCAAVSDYKPKEYFTEKYKKNESNIIIELEANIDIAKTLNANKKQQKVAIFAAESEKLEDYAKQKLTKKNADLVVANYYYNAFNKPDNSVYLLDKNGNNQHLENMSKPDIANEIISCLTQA